MWIGWVCYALLAAGMAYAHTTLQAWGVFLALGVVAGLTESPERALVARAAGARQGSGFGAYHGLTGFAALAGGLVLGGVFQAYGGAAAFVASAAAGGVLALAGPGGSLRRPPPRDPRAGNPRPAPAPDRGRAPFLRRSGPAPGSRPGRGGRGKAKKPLHRF